MCSLGKFDATLVNSKLMTVSFTIQTGDADIVLETLKKKYGSNVSIQNFQVQNGYGATLNYYMAVWIFPNLRVILSSSNHQSLNDAFGTVTIRIPQPGDTPKETRPL